MGGGCGFGIGDGGWFSSGSDWCDDIVGVMVVVGSRIGRVICSFLKISIIK